MIIGLTGVQGSGKTHRQQELVAQGFAALDFKDELLNMASDLVGYDVRQNYDYFKENLLGLTVPAPVGHKWLQRPPAHTLTQQILASYPSAITGRVLLQRLGTEVMRKRNSNHWADEWRAQAFQHVSLGRSVVAADVRFENEVDTIRRLGKLCQVPVKIIFCDYRSARYNPAAAHESERMAQELLARGYKDGDEIMEGK